MTDTPTKALAAKALLPTGLRDLLPPDAEHEAQVTGRLLKEFHRHGYERVKPPLVEFEEGLLSGSAATLANQTFRIMDPVSQRMMGVRSDMTPQVARIATTRLRKAPRPLRLSYAGQVLRVKGSSLRQERQFGQVGVELIGPDRAEADAEIILLAASALASVGAKGISIDLTVPTLVPAVAKALSLSGDDYARLRAALDHRDAAALAEAAGVHAPLFLSILNASGPAPAAVERLAAIDLPDVAQAARRELTDVVRLIAQADPGLSVTIDPVEMRGFEYQTGVSFTIFARGVRGELGRGGRYRTGGADPVGEAATGFTLYTDTVLRALPGPLPTKRVLLPLGTDYAEAQALRALGWHTVAAMADLADLAAEARRLSCSHILTVDGPTPV